MAKKGKKGKVRRRKDKRVSAAWTLAGLWQAWRAKGAYDIYGWDGVFTNLTGVRVGKAGSGFDKVIFKQAATPWAAAFVANVGAKKLKVNKYMKDIPLIGKYFKV